MASTFAVVGQFSPASFYRESSMGYSLTGQSGLYTTSSGGSRGLTLNKFYGASGQATNPNTYEYYNIICYVPKNVTITTGLTWSFTISDDGTSSADLGKAVVLEVTPYNLSTALSVVDWSLAASKGTATLATGTLGATTGLPVIVNVPIVAANLASLATQNTLGFRFRRKGDAVADTCAGRVLCYNCTVWDT